MKYLLFFLLIVLVSCNDGGSDPEFVKTKAKAKVSAKPIYKIGDSLMLAKIKKYMPTQGVYIGDSNDPHRSSKHLSIKKHSRRLSPVLDTNKPYVAGRRYSDPLDTTIAKGQIFFWGSGNKWEEPKKINGNYVPGVIDSVQSLLYGNIRQDTPIKIIGYH